MRQEAENIVRSGEVFPLSQFRRKLRPLPLPLDALLLNSLKTQHYFTYIIK